MQENHKYNIYMVIATIFFGMTYVLTKICLNYSTELHIISFRFLIAFVISLIFLQKKIFPIKITNHHFKWWFALCLKGNATSLRLKPYNWSAFRV